MLQLLSPVLCLLMYVIIYYFSISLYNFNFKNNFTLGIAYCLLVLIIHCNHHMQTLYAKPHLVYVLKTGIKMLYSADEQDISFFPQRNYSIFINVCAGNNHFFSKQGVLV